MHWELPVALYPRRYGDWVYSGARWWTPEHRRFPARARGYLVAIYTSTGRGECIAYSTDRGTASPSIRGTWW